MKTKHLFYTASLAVMMAACANEEIVLDAPQLPVDGNRASVENVKLAFTNGVESRLTFGAKGYAWEATDTIGALLMDAPKPNTSGSRVWTEKYELTDYVNTSYPFTYDLSEGTWGCIGKMLEGNYFFAFPWSSYDGARTVKHSLFNQQQEGVAGKAVAQSYADNQFFVGYSQIKAGSRASETLEDVEMTDVLGAIQLQLVNNTGKTIHVYKAVLNGVPGAVTFAPKTANLDVIKYVEDDYATDVKRADKLREVVKIVETEKTAGAQLFINGTDEERAVAAGGKGYVLIMSAPLTKEMVADATITLYTDEGQMTFSALETDVNSEAVEKVAPGVSSTYEVSVEELTPTVSMEIYSNKDLLRLISWNAKANVATDLTATLKTDLTLTKDVVDLLKSNSNLKLKLTGADKVVTLAANLPTNILEYNKLDVTAKEVIVKGSINLGENTKANADNLTIAEEGTLNINIEVDNDEVILPSTITNYGKVRISAVEVVGTCAFTNEEGAIVEVAADAEVQFAITNKGIVNANGYMSSITNNEEDAIINLAEGATLNSLTNTDGTVNAAANSQIKGGTNSDLIVCAANTAKVAATGGKIAIVATEDVAENAYLNTGFNTLIIAKDIKFNSATTGGIVNVILNEGGNLIAANGKHLSFTSMEVNGDATVTTTTSGASTVLSSVTVTNVKIAEDVDLIVNGTFKVSGSWKNEGAVENNQTVAFLNTLYNTLNTDKKFGKFNKRAPESYEPAKTDLNVTLEVGAKTIKAAYNEQVTGNPKNNIVVNGLKITGTLDMSSKDNSDYTSYFTNVELANNGKIVNLKNSHAISMTKLVVNNNATIDGTAKMVIAKTGTLELNGSLSIANGYLEISNASAVKEMSSEKIYGNGGLNGYICAAITDGYLWWNASSKVWKEQMNAAENNQVVTVNSLDDLNSLNAYYVIVNDNLTRTQTLTIRRSMVLDFNNKTLTNSGSTAVSVEGSNYVIIRNGNITNTPAQKSNSIIKAGDNAKVTIVGGTYKANETTDGYSSICVAATATGKVEINGGNFENSATKPVTINNTGNYEKHGALLNAAGDGVNTAQITVNGGTFTSTNKELIYEAEWLTGWANWGMDFEKGRTVFKGYTATKPEPVSSNGKWTLTI